MMHREVLLAVIGAAVLAVAVCALAEAKRIARQSDSEYWRGYADRGEDMQPS